MVWTIQAQMAIREWRVHERAVMRPARAGMRVGAKVTAGDAHAAHLDRVSVLEPLDHLDESSQEHLLLRSRQRLDSFQEEVGPGRRVVGFSMAFRCERQSDRAGVIGSRRFPNHALAGKSGDGIACRCRRHPKFLSDVLRPHGGASSAPKDGQDLTLRWCQSPPPRLSPSAALERQTDLVQAGYDPVTGGIVLRFQRVRPHGRAYN